MCSEKKEVLQEMTQKRNAIKIIRLIEPLQSAN